MTATSANILGRRHFRVDFDTGEACVATLWVPTTLANADDIWDEATKHARLHECAMAVYVAGEYHGTVFPEV